MDSVLFWVIAANALVWIGLGSYLALLGFRQRHLARRLMQMEILHD